MFRLTIETDNAAFHDPIGDESKNAECARILRSVARELDEHGYHTDLGTIVDINGNTVGEWRLT